VVPPELPEGIAPERSVAALDWSSLR